MRRLEGWSEIADYLGRSEKWCWRWAKKPVGERLPVYRVGGIVCADAEDLDAWVQAAKLADVGSAVPYPLRR